MAEEIKKNDFIIQGTTLYGYVGNDKEAIVPEGVFSISGEMDWGDVERIVLPASLRYISAGAFDSCENLKALKFMDTTKDWYVYDTHDWTGEVCFTRSLYLGDDEEATAISFKQGTCDLNATHSDEPCDSTGFRDGWERK